MGTNYYAKVKDAPALEPLHIGKSSGGWEFLWRAHPELGLESVTQWRKFLDHPWVEIYTDYGSPVTLTAFTNCATEKHPSKKDQIKEAELDHWMLRRMWRDSAGFPFADYEFC